MKFLQIWMGGKVPKVNKECMESVIAQMTNEDEYVFIGEGHFLKDVKAISSEEILKDAPENIKKAYEESETYFYKSSVLRFLYMSQHKDVFYTDCDVILNERLEFEEPSFARFGRLVYDNCVMYNGNNTKMFLDILNESVNSGNKKRGWMHSFIAMRAPKYIDNFQHLQLRG